MYSQDRSYEYMKLHEKILVDKRWDFESIFYMNFLLRRRVGADVLENYVE